jgi:hypothetical protein
MTLHALRVTRYDRSTTPERRDAACAAYRAWCALDEAETPITAYDELWLERRPQRP